MEKKHNFPTAHLEQVIIIFLIVLVLISTSMLVNANAKTSNIREGKFIIPTIVYYNDTHESVK